MSSSFHSPGLGSRRLHSIEKRYEVTPSSVSSSKSSLHLAQWAQAIPLCSFPVLDSKSVELFLWLPSIWWAAVAVPQMNPGANDMSLVSMFSQSE